MGENGDSSRSPRKAGDVFREQPALRHVRRGAVSEPAAEGVVDVAGRPPGSTRAAGEVRPAETLLAAGICDELVVVDLRSPSSDRRCRSFLLRFLRSSRSARSSLLERAVLVFHEIDENVHRGPGPSPSGLHDTSHPGTRVTPTARRSAWRLRAPRGCRGRSARPRCTRQRRRARGSGPERQNRQKPPNACEGRSPWTTVVSTKQGDER